MDVLTSQELNCAIEVIEQKLAKLKLCSESWERLYGRRNMKLEELRKNNTQLLDRYTNQVLLQTEELANVKTDTRQMYGELRRLEKELKILDEAKSRLKGIAVYSGKQEIEESLTLG